jgi:S-adenosylmethionine synthetase
MSHTFTSESVCAGHPDKICDQISDAIVDAVLTRNPNGRAAIETLVTKDQVVVAGEIKLDQTLDIEAIARDQIKRLGYDEPIFEFSHQSPLEVYVHHQSPDIAVGVDQGGAGDQGMMFGYACQETPELMPLPIILSHRLAEKIDQVRQTKLNYLRPDGKTQVTVDYEHGQPAAVTQLVLAVPHQPAVKGKQVKHDLYQQVVRPVLAEYGFELSLDQIILNGTGVWNIGGPQADTGVTGRKIVVDTYGGMARVGGGCFSGKDPSKVDRSGAYAARFMAKNLVAHGLAERAEVSLAYCIGQPKPVMQQIETFGSAQVSDKKIKEFLDQLLDTSVKGILEALKLQRPIYLPTATYGHFGRKDFSWEEVV